MGAISQTLNRLSHILILPSHGGREAELTYALQCMSVHFLPKAVINVLCVAVVAAGVKNNNYSYNFNGVLFLDRVHAWTVSQ